MWLYGLSHRLEDYFIGNVKIFSHIFCFFFALDAFKHTILLGQCPNSSVRWLTTYDIDETRGWCYPTDVAKHYTCTLKIQRHMTWDATHMACLIHENGKHDTHKHGFIDWFLRLVRVILLDCLQKTILTPSSVDV